MDPKAKSVAFANDDNKIILAKPEGQNLRKKCESILNYNALDDNAILHVVYTIDNIIVLLKNGILISWGNSVCTLGRKLTSNTDSYVPGVISIPVKIVDIAAGRSHILARGQNKKVYSWGKNTCGQLGLSGYDAGANIESDVPQEIQSFQNISIKQIFASGSTSFAISEGGNNLYGWGDNRNGQLGLNNETNQMFSVPVLIDQTQKSLSTVIVYQYKDGSKTLIAELFRPASRISESMEYFQNKILDLQEKDLEEEERKLREKEEELKRRVKEGKVINPHLYYSTVVGEIDWLVEEYNKKKKKIEEKIRNLDQSRYQENLKSFDGKIEASKKHEEENRKGLKEIEKMERQLDTERMKVINEKKNLGASADNEKFIQEMKAKKLQIIDEKLKVIGIGQLIESVNAGCHELKNISMNQAAKDREIKDELNKKRLEKKELNDLFLKTQEVSKKIVKNYKEKQTIKDAEYALKELGTKHPILLKNLIPNYEQITPDTESLFTSIKASNTGLKDLETLLDNDVLVDKQNKLGVEMKKVFQDSILLAKQNNGLLDLFLNCSKFYYNYSLEQKAVKVESENNEMINTIKNTQQKVDEEAKKEIENE